jgi:c-di-GMP-binding flagellar brake protein YcgR
MGNLMEEMKRKHLRVLADMKIDVCQLPDDDALDAERSMLRCTARDISGGGLSFYGNSMYSDYSLLRLQIPLRTGVSQSEESIKVMGKVMWSRKKKNDAEQYATGVQFLNIYAGDFDLLERYVQEHISI